MSIDLRMFCAAEDSARWRFTRPWVYEGWEYASDGRVMIRVPREAGNTESEDGLGFPPAREIFRDKHDAIACTAQWPQVWYCLHCLGRGVRGGDDCETCGDKASEYKCVVCNGVAKSPEVLDFEGLNVIQIGRHKIQVLFDAKIRMLPNVRYAPTNNPASPLPFVFDGGEGCVMGVKQ